MSTPTTLSARDLRRVMATYGELLRSHREIINRLNVYPVPDGDTGTNMALTIESVTTALDALAESAPMGEVAKTIARGSLMGARGNSGVILSQLLRGLVGEFSIEGDVSADELASALAHADELARQAVLRPVEGTILSVARGAAQGAREHQESLLELARGARDGSKVALEQTPEQLAVLKRAGVVDSGGTGLVLFFDAMCFVIGGDALPMAPNVDTVEVHVHEEPPDSAALSELRYEVMYLLDADDAKMHAFREVWAGLGDSIVIVGGEGIYNCHIHTNEVGPAIEACFDAGRPRDIRITDLTEQVVEERWVREATLLADDVEDPPPATAVVAVVVGEGIGRIFHSLGVRQLVMGGQSMNPSTQELVDAVERTGSGQVVLLPNNKNIQPVAEQVVGLASQDVAVVATTSVVEGFAALLAYDPDASLEANVAAMHASACNVVAGEITQAVRDTTTDAGDVHEGDWIGLGAKGVLSIADSIAAASNQLLEHLVRPEHELLTIIEGDGSSPANTRRVTEYLAEEHPQISVEVHYGGQPLYPYYFGLE
jgi:DAK2 domain fusion protein YloV